MDAPSKERSRAFVKLRLGSPRKRIYRGQQGVFSLECKELTPLEPDGSSILPHAFMTKGSFTETTKTLPASFSLEELM
jgi:hypothetical protein